MLFEYQVRDDDGVLVIRLGGSLIAQSLKPLREQTAEGQTSLAALMSPLAFIGHLLSPTVDLPDQAGSSSQVGIRGASQGVAVASTDWLGQELAQTFEDFQGQIQEFRAALEEIKGGLHAVDSEPESTSD